MHGTSTDEVMCDGPTAQPGEIGREGLLADHEWPTTQRFSRRAGEAFRGADYAAAVEVLADSSFRDAIIAIVIVIGTVLGAAVTILWQG
jgi:hypothetical protein